MDIFNRIWIEDKFMMFKRDVPRVSSRFDIERFEELVMVILFKSSKQAENDFFLSDKTIKKIKDILTNMEE